MTILLRNIHLARATDFKHLYMGGLRDQVTHGLAVFAYVADLNNNHAVILKK